ncbi:MAG: type I restriction enzyme R subunit, partial [Roseivirga sp.]
VHPNEKLIILSKAVEQVVDGKAKYTDCSKQNDIELKPKVDLIMFLAEYDYSFVEGGEVYKKIFEQAQNFKKYNG